jgi:AcrR family transcriptional regulator
MSATGQTLTRKQKQERTRSSLLRSAAKLISQRGITEASVDEIAGHAGYTKGAFYANFTSKEAMFLAMLDEKYAAELERLEAHLPGDGQPADEVRESAEDFVRFARSDPDWPKLYFEFVAYAARKAQFRRELARRDRAMRARIAAVIRNWAADFQGQPPFSYEDLALMLFSMANGFLMTQLIEPDLGEELYGTMNATFFKGIAVSAMDLDLDDLAEAQEAKPRKAGAGR